MSKHSKRGSTIITLGVAMSAAHKTMQKLATRGVVADTVNGVNKVDPVLTADIIGRSIMNKLVEKRNAK